MNARLALEQLTNVVKIFKDLEPEERIKYFGTITSITNKLLELSEKVRYKKAIVCENIIKLLWSIETLCRLADGNDKSDSEHIIWALGAIDTLKSSIDWEDTI